MYIKSRVASGGRLSCIYSQVWLVVGDSHVYTVQVWLVVGDCHVYTVKCG